MRHNARTHSGDSPNIVHTSTGTRQLRQNYVCGKDSFVYETLYRHTLRRRPKHPPHVNRKKTTAPKLCIRDLAHSYLRHNAHTYAGGGPNIRRTSTGKDESYRIIYMGHDSSVYETHAMQAHTQEAARAFFARQLDEDIGAKTATPTPHQQWERCPK